MDTSIRVAAMTAIAPIAWGTTYIVTEQLLPPDRPLFAAAVRALPAGLVLLAVRRTLPSGSWWWKAGVLGLVNIGVFFPLLFLAAYHLPGGLAATMQASSPLAVMAVALWMLREHPGRARVLGALVGLVGVGLLVLRAEASLDMVGVAAALASVAVSAVGFVLVKRWQPPVDMVTLVSWQLVAGGIVLVPVAAIVEGAPPVLDTRAVVGLTWIAVVGTVVAYVAWFRGLSLMPAGATALIGLLNPVVGTVLGVVVAKEAFGWWQALGMLMVLGGVLAGQPATAQWWRRVSGRPPLDAHEAGRELGGGADEALPVAGRLLDELPRT